MSIHELINAIPEDEVFVQGLAQNFCRWKAGKKDGELTFFTSLENGSIISKAAFGVGEPRKIGIVVWLPGDAVDRAKARRQPAEPQRKEKL